MEDKQIREELSQMLDSFESKDWRYRGEIEVKVLSWSQIFFEIGKLKNQCSTLSDYRNLQNQINSLRNLMNPYSDEDKSY